MQKNLPMIRIPVIKDRLIPAVPPCLVIEYYHPTFQSANTLLPHNAGLRRIILKSSGFRSMRPL